MNLKKLRALQQEASEFAGPWQSMAGEIYNENGERVARVDLGTVAAQYICMIHNTWLLLTNHILLLRRALADKKAMTAATRKDT